MCELEVFVKMSTLEQKEHGKVTMNYLVFSIFLINVTANAETAPPPWSPSSTLKRKDAGRGRSAAGHGGRTDKEEGSHGRENVALTPEGSGEIGTVD